MERNVPMTIRDQLQFFHSMPSLNGTSRLSDVSITDHTQNSKHKTATGLHVIVDDKSKSKLHEITLLSDDIRLIGKEKDWQKVTKLTIICDTLTIRCRWWLPECDVEIYARRVEFEGDGCLDTSPPPWASDKAQNSFGKTSGSNGANGHPGGDVLLYVNEIVAPAEATMKRIVTDGGNGQGGGHGQNGDEGNSVSGHLYLPSDYVDSSAHTDSGMRTVVNVTLGKHGSRPVLGIRRIWKVMEFATGSNTLEGTSQTPTDGKPAIPPGDSGDGGAAGKLTANKQVTIKQAIGNLWSGRPGKAGSLAPVAKGGKAGEPVDSVFYECTYWHKIGDEWRIWKAFAEDIDNSASAKVEMKEYHTEDGKTYEAKPGSDAQPVEAKIVDADANIWLHPSLVPLVMDYIRECYLTEQRDEAKRMVRVYGDAFLLPLPTDSKFWKKKDGAYWQATQVELMTLSQQLASHLDYFGKPAGYTPLLSLSGSFQLYRMETDLALEVMMFAKWVQEKQRAQGETAESAEAASRMMVKENAILIDKIKGIEAMAAGLKTRIAALGRAQDRIQGKLGIEYTRLYNQAAKDGVRIGQIKFAANLAAALCQVIPVGQPILGGVTSIAAESTDFIDKEPDEVIKSLKTKFSTTIDAYKAAEKDIEEVVKKAKDEAKELAAAEDGKKLTVDDIKKLSETKPSAWSTAGKGLAPAFSHLKKAYESVQLPEAEIEIRLAKLAAQDETWKQLSKEIKELIEQRSMVYKEMVQLGQQVGQSYASLAGNWDSLAGLFDKSASARTRLMNAGAFQAIEGMRNRAGLALTESLYNIVRAFESFLFKPANIDCWSLSILDEINTVLNDKPIHQWSDKDIKARVAALKPFFIENLSKIRQGFTKNMPKIIMADSDIDFDIDSTSEAEIMATLNEGRSAQIDTLRLNVIEPNWQRQVMANLTLNGIEFEEVDDVSPKGDIEIIVEAGELGVMRSDDQLYGIRLPAPIVKSFRYHFADKRITKDRESELSKDLINQILGDMEDKIRQKMAMPSAWTTLTITANFNWRGKGAAPKIKRLDFTMAVSRQSITGKQIVLDVSSSDGCSPVRLVRDGSSRELTEAYFINAGPESIELDIADQDAARAQFNGWRIRQGRASKIEKARSIKVDVNLHTKIEALFGASGQSL